MIRQTLPPNTSRRKVGIKPTMYGSRQKTFSPITSAPSRSPTSLMRPEPSPFQELRVAGAQNLPRLLTNILRPHERNPKRIRFAAHEHGPKTIGRRKSYAEAF